MLAALSVLCLPVMINSLSFLLTVAVGVLRDGYNNMEYLQNAVTFKSEPWITPAIFVICPVTCTGKRFDDKLVNSSRLCRSDSPHRWKRTTGLLWPGLCVVSFWGPLCSLPCGSVLSRSFSISPTVGDFPRSQVQQVEH